MLIFAGWGWETDHVALAHWSDHIDMIDPISNERLSSKDIIPVNTGGTGFAGSGGGPKMAQVMTPSMMAG